MRQLRASAVLVTAALLCGSVSGCTPKPVQLGKKSDPIRITASPVTSDIIKKPAQPQEDKPEPVNQGPEQTPLKIGVIGDSITDGLGFPNRYSITLETLLQENFPGSEVDAYGISGQTCRKLKKRFTRNVIENDHDTALIQCGTNDLYMGFGLKRIMKDITSMVELAKRSNLTVVLVTVGPLNGYPGWTSQKEQRRQGLNNWVLNYPGVIVADVAAVLSEGDPPSLKREFRYKDALHPNAEGLDAMAGEIAKAIESAATQ